MPNPIVDPTGRPSHLHAGFHLAPRRHDIRGATVALFDNGKQNADLLLDELGRVLLERFAVERVVMSKKRVGTAAAPIEELEQLLGQGDVVVTAVGDCGSCSASAVADGIALERLGMPAVVVCSDSFRASADAIAKVHGAPGYRYVTVPHPVAGLTEAQVREKARSAADEVASLLVAAEVANVA